MPKLIVASEIRLRPLPSWELWMIFEVEPLLSRIARDALKFFDDEREDAYQWAKPYFSLFVGWEARDPRLRSREAYDCYTNWLLHGEGNPDRPKT